MKRLFLTLALMASFSTVYSMNSEMTLADKKECIKITRDLEACTYGFPIENCDPQEDPNDMVCQYSSDNRDLIESLVTRMNTMISRYPHDPRAQAFVPTRNDMQTILTDLIAAEENQDSESN